MIGRRAAWPGRGGQTPARGRWARARGGQAPAQGARASARGRRARARGRATRSRGRRSALVAALLAVAAVALPALAGSETSATVTAENVGLYEHRWSPAQVTVSTVAGVTISNPTTVYHGVDWIAPPSAPSCDAGVPVGTTAAASASNWKGTCTFSVPGTYTYYCTVHGSAMSGTITVKAPGTPKALTSAAEATQTTATLHGSIDPEGNSTSYYFKYGLDSKLEQRTPSAPVGPADFGEHPLSASLSGLEPAKTYHVELVAVYGASAEQPGGEQTFTTPAAAAPTVVTTSATVEGEHKATLHGTVDPNGGNATEYFFQYGATAGYGSQTASVAGLAADNATHAASAAVPGSPAEEELKPGTTYHFRLVASNEAGGPSFGEDRTFTTASPPPPPPPPPPKEEPPPAPAPSPAPAPTSPAPSVPLVLQPMSEAGPGFGPALIAGSLKLHSHGASVRGSIGIGLAGAGGRLEVDLLAKPSALGARSSKPVVAGRFVRSSVPSGNASFSVALSSRAKSALRRHRRLALTVKLTLTPPGGAAASAAKALVLHA
jgi:plastocyanin